MPSNRSSRKLCHVLQYLIEEQIRMIPLLKSNADGIDERYQDALEAAVIVARLREVALDEA